MVMDDSMKYLTLTTGVIGSIQGLAWSLLSLIVVLIYHGVILIESSDTNNIGHILNALYLKNDSDFLSVDGVIVKGDGFSYFMYIYMIISVCLLVVSLVCIWMYVTSKGEQFHDQALKTWIGVMGSTSILDFILLCLLIHDYSKLYKHYSDEGYLDNAETHLYLVAVGIVMTLAARGFVLWIVNVVFVVILAKYIHQNRGIRKPTDTLPVIDAYSTPPRPWTSSSFNDPIRSDYDNKAYQNDDNSPYQFIDDRNNRNNEPDRNTRPSDYREFPQSNNMRNNDQPRWNNNRYNREGNAQFAHNYTNEQNRANPYGQPSGLRTAKIGRQGGQRSPPLNVAPPFIPDPDYSPPGSPKIRGVLRPSSNYM